jgi:hypothetical protein
MNAQEQEQMVAAREAVEKDIKDRLEWEIGNAERKESAAKERIKNDANSDWALMSDLAEAYGARAANRYRKWLLEQQQLKVPSWKSIDDLMDRVLDDVLIYRGHNSSNGASNLIKEEEHQQLMALLVELRGLQFKAHLTKEQ